MRAMTSASSGGISAPNGGAVDALARPAGVRRANRIVCRRGRTGPRSAGCGRSATSAGSSTSPDSLHSQLAVGVGVPVAGVAVGLQPADRVGQRVHRVSIHLSRPYRGRRRTQPGGVRTGVRATCQHAGRDRRGRGGAGRPRRHAATASTAAPGGAPYNVARGCARLGAPTALLATRVRRRLRPALAAGLAESGVDDALLQRTDAADDARRRRARRRAAAATYRFYTEGTSAPLLTPGRLPDGADVARDRRARPRPRADGDGDRVAPCSAPAADVLVVVDVNCRPAAVADRAALRRPGCERVLGARRRRQGQRRGPRLPATRASPLDGRRATLLADGVRRRARDGGRDGDDDRHRRRRGRPCPSTPVAGRRHDRRRRRVHGRLRRRGGAARGRGRDGARRRRRRRSPPSRPPTPSPPSSSAAAAPTRRPRRAPGRLASDPCLRRCRWLGRTSASEAVGSERVVADGEALGGVVAGHRQLDDDAQRRPLGRRQLLVLERQEAGAAGGRSGAAGSRTGPRRAPATTSAELVAGVATAGRRARPSRGRGGTAVVAARNSASAWRAWMSQSTISSLRRRSRRTAPRSGCARCRRARSMRRVQPGLGGVPGGELPVRPEHVGRRRLERRRSAGAAPTAPRRAWRPAPAPATPSAGRARRGGPGRRRRGAAPGRSPAARRCEALIRRPCSSHVYQVTDTPASRATSSRRRPGVRRPRPRGSLTCSGRHRLAPGAQELGELGALVAGRRHRRPVEHTGRPIQVHGRPSAECAVASPSWSHGADRSDPRISRQALDAD